MRKTNVNDTYPRTTKYLPPYCPPIISIGTTKKRILDVLKKGGNAHSISKNINTSRQNVIQHLQSLERQGLTIKENHVWKLTNAGKEYLEEGKLGIVGYERGGVSSTTEWLQDRPHNIKIKVSIEKQPTDLNWLTNWKKNPLKNVTFYTDRFGDIVTTYTGISFIFQLPILNYKDSELAVAEAGRIAKHLINRYENIVKGLKLSNFEVTYQLITQHHAIPQEPYSKWCYRHGISYKDDIIDIDASKTPELEFTNSQHSHEHFKKYVDYVEDFATKETIKPSELPLIFNRIEQQIQSLAQAQTNMITLLTPKEPLQDNNLIDLRKMM